MDPEAALVDHLREHVPDHDSTAVLLLLWTTRLGRLMELFHHQMEVGSPKLDTACRTVLAILFVSEPTPLSPTDLSRAIVQTSGGMTKTLRRLESESLVSRLTNKHDARAVEVRLTASGRAWIRRHLDDLADRWESNLERSPEIDRAAAAATTGSLVAMLERATKATDEESSGVER